MDSVGGWPLGHGTWVRVKDKVMWIMALPHAQCKKMCFEQLPCVDELSMLSCVWLTCEQASISSVMFT